MNVKETQTLINLTKDKNAILWKINDNLKIIVLAIKIAFWVAALTAISFKFL